MLCRAIGARRIVEAGTSFGVSTLYLAAAVRDNGGGVVFGAEYEPEAETARAAMRRCSSSSTTPPTASGLPFRGAGWS
jgi:predicted O-methyltransferase YrrM